MRIEVLFVASSMTVFHVEAFETGIAEFDQSRMAGRLKDGRSFRVVVKNNRFWLDRIAGLRFDEFRLLGAMSMDINQSELNLIKSRVSAK